MGYAPILRLAEDVACKQKEKNHPFKKMADKKIKFIF